ncbi:MAG: chemotaxis protein CheW [Gammaproteobacteria bacterium]|nr:chemotaxis protein CheW [Gammaproteobacteria bacterium]
MIDHPFSLLSVMDDAARAAKVPLPREEAPVQSWSGLAVRAGSRQLVLGLEQVRDVVTVGSMTSVPGTEPWLRGLANVRGDLLAVTDLAAFFGDPATASNPATRLLVMRSSQLKGALMVSAVLGLRHFLEDQRQPGPAGDTSLDPFVSSSFRSEGGTWFVLDLDALAGDERFLRAAA